MQLLFLATVCNQQSFNYLSSMKHYSEIITINADTRFGRPSIRGMRITVYDILGWFASGMTKQEILNDFPELTEDDLQAALSYAADREHKILIAS
jgi:uncharacterized protein (DUF433 family)